MRLAPLLCCGLAASLALADELTVNPTDLPRVEPTPPDAAAATFEVAPGFRMELMAAEPLIQDPVAMAFDAEGQLYMVEMRDYSERRDEHLGRVKLLRDTDGDGRLDEAKVFAADLPWPTGVTCWDGGVFVLASPDLLYLKDTDGDGVADVRKVVFTGFATLAPRLNVQALPNSLQWGPDQRVHGALGGNGSRIENPSRPDAAPVVLRGRDFSFDPRKLDLRAESGGGQWGMTFDDLGRKFVCSNSHHLQQVMYEERIAATLEHYPLPAANVDIAPDGPQAPVFRLSPDEPWRVIRTKWRVSGLVKGPVEGGGRASGYFTSACAVTIYRGDAWPRAFAGHAFIADCGSNLIHRKVLAGEGVQLTGQRVPGEEHREFIASRDNWFRPVAFANAPDGCLWVADMYREIVEHPWSLPESLKKHLDLNSGWDRGRLWRISPTDATPAKGRGKVAQLTSAELVEMLGHANGWHRDTAARLLHERQDATVVPALEKLATSGETAAGRIAAMRVLHGLNALVGSTIAQNLRAEDEGVRANAVRLGAMAGLLPESLGALANDPSPQVRAELSWALATHAAADKVELLADLLDRADEPWLQHAALSAAGDATTAVLARLAGRESARLPELQARLGIGTAKAAAVKMPALPPAGVAPDRAEAWKKYRRSLELPGDSGRGKAIFAARCALCHRLRGEGHAVGPDLDASAAAGREKLLGNILEPSREITAGFASGIVETKSGEALAGILANETGAGVVLRLPGGIERVVPKAEIRKVERRADSLMPAGLEAGLSEQEMADLLEHLMTPESK